MYKVIIKIDFLLGGSRRNHHSAETEEGSLNLIIFRQIGLKQLS